MRSLKLSVCCSSMVAKTGVSQAQHSIVYCVFTTLHVFIVIANLLGYSSYIDIKTMGNSFTLARIFFRIPSQE